MNSNGHGGHWPPRDRSGPFRPVAGTFSGPAPQPTGYNTRGPRQRQPPIAPSPTPAFFPPQHAYNGTPTVPISDVEFQQAHANFSAAPFEEPLNAPLFASHGPVAEEVVPAPGHENDHITVPETFEKSRYDFETSSEDYLSDSEEERLNAVAALTHDREDDQDFSLSDNELEEKPEDFIIDGADPSEEDVPKRAKKGTRGRGRPKKHGTRGRPKSRKIGPRPIADPGPEFKEMQRLANEAYVKEDYVTALSYAKAAIELNPEVFSAYSLLSEIFASMGDEAESIGALMGGAPTQRDKQLWYLLLDRIESIDPREYPTMNLAMKDKLSAACLTSIIALDSEDWSARYKKLAIEVRRQRYSSCVTLCRKMLRITPHDKQTLVTMARMGTANARQTSLHLRPIIKSFESTINHFVKLNNPSETDLDFSFLLIYLDLLDKEGDYNYALFRLKSLSRWIQKRAKETYWDKVEDDREFDFEDVPRRIAIAEFVRQKRKRRGSYGKGLPLEIIIKMGVFRLRMSPPNFDEAIRHLNLLFPEDDQSEESLLWDDSRLFGVAAKTLYETGHVKEALRFYEPLHRHGLLQYNLETYTGLYNCYRKVGDTEKAEHVLSSLKDWRFPADDLKDLATLAKFFEDQGFMSEAMQRAEIIFKERASMLLRNNGFQHYDELRNHFFAVRKRAVGRAVGKHVAKRTRVRKHMRKLKAATRNEMGSDQDESNDNVTSVHGSLAHAPLSERPKKGLFRSQKSLSREKIQTFMPVEEHRTLAGTDVPLTAIDHHVFRMKLDNLANDHADEVAAARVKHREITASFVRLRELCSEADNGNQSACTEYLSIARELIEEFSTFDIFYSERRSREFAGYFRRTGSGDLWKESALMILAVQANRKEDDEAITGLEEKPDTVPEDFYGVHFDEWAEVFCRYALLLAREGAEDRCFNVLDVALQSNIFYTTQKYTRDVELCRMACALAVDDSRQASAAVRYFLKIYPFGTEIFRLYSVVNRLCSIHQGYATGAAQKVVLRWIKTIDYALLSPDNRKWYNFRGIDRTQWVSYIAGLFDHVKGHDPAIFALFGHLLMCTGSYTSALNYFFRAFAMTPEDPVLSLSIGMAYFQHALKRLSENRQYQIQQGIAFVTRYYDLRTSQKVALHVQEAEFNVGRLYHGLGLMSQAVPYYQRCLALSDQVQREASTQDHEHGGVEDFAAEAAYALQTIYVLGEDFESAFEVSMSNLVIE